MFFNILFPGFLNFKIYFFIFIYTFPVFLLNFFLNTWYLLSILDVKHWIFYYKSGFDDTISVMLLGPY